MLIMVVIVIGVTVITFLIMQLSPGDPVELMAGPRVTPERIEALKARFGLDKPIYIQYFYWLSRIIQGDFGTSIVTGQPAGMLIYGRVPYTLVLTTAAMSISLLVGIPLGVMSAIRQYSVLDYISTGAAFFWLSMPGFWLGLMLMLIFGLYLGWLPISGYRGLSSLVLPAVTLGLPQIASILRLTRSDLLEVIREDYITAVRAKGMRERIVLYRHALRNAIIPVVMITFLSIPWLIGGAVVIETVFAWPGMGRLLYKAIVGKDFPIVQGIIFIIAILTVLSNLAGDILAAYLDPRIRYE
jgi:ABC-type dipeptide/oligopeptide/nickel transport system permease component